MKNKPVILYGIVFLALGIGGFWLQRYLLNQMQQSELFIVRHGEETYYGEDISYVENNSINNEKMNYLDKLKLFKNEKQRTRNVIDHPDAEVFTLREASVFAKKKFFMLYDLGLVPVSIESSIDNWYTYRGTLYEYKDKVFGNFKCKIWIIEYIAYDHSVHVELTMDAQSGTVYQCNITSAEGMLDIDVFNEFLFAGKEELVKGCSILLDDIEDQFKSSNDVITKRFHIKDDESEEPLSSNRSKYLCVDNIIKEEFYVIVDNNRDNFAISFEIP